MTILKNGSVKVSGPKLVIPTEAKKGLLNNPLFCIENHGVTVSSLKVKIRHRRVA